MKLKTGKKKKKKKRKSAKYASGISVIKKK